MTWPILRNRLKSMILLAGVLLTVGCAGPISVERVDHATLHQELTRNVLSARTLSGQTRNVLRQWSLTDRFQETPEYAIADLHAAVAEGRGQADAVGSMSKHGRSGVVDGGSGGSADLFGRQPLGRACVSRSRSGLLQTITA
jgi:hypothetical protein